MSIRFFRKNPSTESTLKSEQEDRKAKGFLQALLETFKGLDREGRTLHFLVLLLVIICLQTLSIYQINRYSQRLNQEKKQIESRLVLERRTLSPRFFHFVTVSSEKELLSLLRIPGWKIERMEKEKIKKGTMITAHMVCNNVNYRNIENILEKGIPIQQCLLQGTKLTCKVVKIIIKS